MTFAVVVFITERMEADISLSYSMNVGGGTEDFVFFFFPLIHSCAN